MKSFFGKFALLLIVAGIIPACGLLGKKQTGQQNLQINPPVLLQKIEPHYPPEARVLGIEGSVRMYLYISESGTVEDLKIVSSSGSPELDRAAEEYGRSLEFRPATRDDDPLAVWLSWEVNYNLSMEMVQFNINNYIKKIRRLIALASASSGNEKEKLLADILKENETYFDFIQSNPEVNLNQKLQPMLSDQVWEQWRRYWPEWPLTFVIGQDLTERFSDSRSISLIRDIEITQLIKDLKRISLTESSLKKTFFQDVADYLRKNNPGGLENDQINELLKSQRPD